MIFMSAFVPSHLSRTVIDRTQKFNHKYDSMKDLSPLLRLPAELRNLIYSEVLVEQDSIDSQPWRFSDDPWVDLPATASAADLPPCPKRSFEDLLCREHVLIYDRAIDNLVPRPLEFLRSLDQMLRLALRCVWPGSVIIHGDDWGSSWRGRTDSDMDDIVRADMRGNMKDLESAGLALAPGTSHVPCGLLCVRAKNGEPSEWIEGWANELSVEFARMKCELMRGRSEDEVCAEYRADVERDHARAAAEVLSRRKGAWYDASSEAELTPWTG